FESFQRIFNRDELHSLVNQMTYFDLKGSLPALLHVEDRTSMAASIESRVPLLDHRIVEFMATIPPNIKFAGGRMKHLFKESVRNAVPQKIFDRKDKMGFPTPLTQWTKGVARDFVRDTLLSDKARQRGLYNLDVVEKMLGNEREFGRVVWGLLSLELWHRIFIDGDLKPSGI
ncbi:MAG: asparagine synthase, partial [Pseudomonas sp.]|nr:asparagine synthase [Pseudomonas sp.]